MKRVFRLKSSAICIGVLGYILFSFGNFNDDSIFKNDGFRVYNYNGESGDFMKSGNVRVLNVFKSDKSAYTQGLEIDENGILYHATGRYGTSGIGILDKENGILNYIVKLDEKYFGEGITISPKGIWQLTYKENTVFLRDKKSLNVLKFFSYDTEGWGISYNYDENNLLMSDGSDEIFIRDVDSFEVLDSFKLTLNGKKLERLNELEYFDGYLYANIWQTFDIVKIDLKKREVVKVYNFEKIIKNLNIPKDVREKMDVLNGIAHIDKNRFYVTGKYYPVLLEVELD